MKKFLTVLLVIAVMFTFSFGTAFAATITDSALNANVNTAQGQVVSTFNTNYNNAVASLTDGNVGSVSVSKAAWQKAATKYYEKATVAIAKRSNEIKTTGKGQDESNYTVALIAGMYDGETVGSFEIKLTQADIFAAIKADADVQQAAIYEDFAAYKNAAINALNAVDLSIYSTTTPTTGDTYYEQAQAKINAALETINAVIVDEETSAIDIATAIGTIGKIKAVGAAATISENGTGALAAIKTVLSDDDADKVVTGYELKDHIKTIAEETADGLTADAKRAQLFAEVNQNAAAFYATVAADTKNLAANMKLKDAYVEIQTYLINNTKDAALGTLTIATLGAGDKYVEALAAMNEVKAYADKYVVARDSNGNLIYDAELVEEDLVATLLGQAKAAKNYVWGASEITLAKNTVICDANKVAETVDPFEVEKKVAALEKAKEDAEALYYAPEYAEVVALYDAAIAKAKAATTAKELEDAKVDTTALNKVVKADAVRGTISGTVTTEFAKLEQYMTYKNATATDKMSADAYKATFDVKAALGTVDATDWTEWYAENGARSAADVKALYDKAVAAIDAVPTVSAVKAQKADVEAKIAALPTTITSADKDAVIAAYEAFAAYPGNDIVNQATLNLAVSSLATALQKDINTAAKALPAVTKVTVADKDAVKAVQAMIDDYKALKAADGVFENEGNFAAVVAPAIVQSDLNQIKVLEKNAVIAAVNALPANVTLADKDAVEAARKAYDAYVAEYSDATATPAVDARIDLASVVKELKAAEEKIAEATDAENEAAIKSVESLKLKASTAAYKGYIRLKWTVSGDAANADGFQIYRSTKSSSAGKKIYTTKKATTRSFKNTTVKKGTKYYYKVRAFKVVDGVTYYSDWSSRGIRTAK